MNILLFIIYPLLALLLFFKAGFFKKDSFNEECLGLSQTKALLGFFSICIILHHVSQKPASFEYAALAPFRTSGYLFVSFFFFCSGYGLLKSFSSKPDYLKGFLNKRYLPLLITFFASDILFQFARYSRAEPAFPANTYSWFVFAIMLLYAAFYLCFKFLKKLQPLVLLALVIAACIICRLLYAETYLYNSILAFPAGVLFASQEVKLIPLLKKRYIPFIIVSLAISALLIFICSSDLRFYTLTGNYTLSIDLQTLLQLFASLFFCFSIILISLKLRVGNKALSFLGGMTLELYLVHVIFVELFTEKFIGSCEPLYFIENQFVYILVILILTLPVAFVIKLLRVKLPSLIIGKPFTQYINRIFKKILIVAAIILVLTTLYFMISSHSKTRNTQQRIKDYQKDFITMKTVDGKNMGAYITGQGELTLLVFSDLEDPAPSMTLRPFAEQLGEHCKVIIPDYFGKGFSDETDKARTSENIAAEIDSFMTSLGYTDGGSIIVFAIGSGGLYAHSYVQNYRNDVKAIIGYDVLTKKIAHSRYNTEGLTPLQRNYAAFVYAKRWANTYAFMKLTGYIRLELAAMEEVFQRTIMKDYYDIISEMMISKRLSKTNINSQSRLFEEADKVDFVPLVKDRPFCLYTTDYKEEKIYQEEITNPALHSVIKLTGGGYFIFYSPQSVATQVINFLETI